MSMSWLWGGKDKIPTDEDFMEKPFTQEENEICQIIISQLNKKGYESTISHLYPDTLLRYVRAFCVNPNNHKKSKQQKMEETTEYIINYLNTFQKYEFDAMLNHNTSNNNNNNKTENIDNNNNSETSNASSNSKTFNTAEIDTHVYSDAWPLFGYGYDKYGHPVYWDCVSDSNEEKITEKFGIDANNDGHYEMNWDLLFGYKYKFMRRLHNCKLIQSQKSNKLIYKHILIFDVAKASMGLSEFMGMKAKCTKKIVQTDSMMFPDTVYRLYIVNASKAFRIIWGIISAFLDPVTASKTQVLGPDFLKELTKQVSIDQIPPKYGGKGKWEIKMAYIADMDDDEIDSYKPTKDSIDLFGEISKTSMHSARPDSPDPPPYSSPNQTESVKENQDKQEHSNENEKKENGEQET